MARIAVFGAGGVGGYIAAMPARSGHWVALIARNQNLDAINKDRSAHRKFRGNNRHETIYRQRQTG